MEKVKFMKEPVFLQLGKKAKYAVLTDRERKAYNESLKAYRDAYAIAETERAEGRAEGLAEGRAEVAIEYARAMLENGIGPDVVAKVTGLTIEKILSL